jgi:hypothetical protein
MPIQLKQTPACEDIFRVEEVSVKSHHVGAVLEDVEPPQQQQRQTPGPGGIDKTSVELRGYRVSSRSTRSGPSCLQTAASVESGDALYWQEARPPRSTLSPGLGHAQAWLIVVSSANALSDDSTLLNASSYNGVSESAHAGSPKHPGGNGPR